MKVGDTVYIGQVSCKDDACYQFLTEKFASEHPSLTCYKLRVEEIVKEGSL